MNREKMRASKTHRLWRGLAFEQVESRLALSAASALDVAEVDLSWERGDLLAAYQGGFVDFDLRPFADQIFLNTSGPRNNATENFDSAEINLRDWIQFESTLGIYDSSDFTTIPQPSVGPAKPHGGMIAIGEIFAVAPLVKMGNNPEEVSQVIRGKFEGSEIISADERLPLSRARDVYFEVATRVDDSELDSPNRHDHTESLVASVVPGDDDESNPKSTPMSIAALAARGHSLPTAQNTVPSEPVQIRDAAKPLREAPSMTQSPDSENKSEKATRPKQVSQTDVRDQVFQAWQVSDLDVLNRVPGRPSEEKEDDVANWPALAALAVGGMVFTSRRLSRPVPSLQQPTSRRLLGFSRLKS